MTVDPRSSRRSRPERPDVFLRDGLRGIAMVAVVAIAFSVMGLLLAVLVDWLF